MLEGDRHKNYYAATAKAKRLRKQAAELKNETREHREEVKSLRQKCEAR